MTSKEVLWGAIGAAIGAIATYVVMDFLHERELDDVYAEVDAYRQKDADAASATYGGDLLEELDSGGKLVHLPEKEQSGSGVRTEDESPFTVEGVAGGGKVGHCVHDVPLDKPCLLCDGATEDPHGMLDTPVPVEEAHILEGHDDDKTLHVYGATACVEGADLIFDETAGIWVHDTDEHEPWTGPDPADAEAFVSEEDAEAQALEALQAEDAAEPDPELIYILSPDKLGDRPQIIGNYNHLNQSYELAKSMSAASPDFDDVIENDALYSLLGEEPYTTLMESEPTPAGEDNRLLVVRNDVLNLDFVITY